MATAVGDLVGQVLSGGRYHIDAKLGEGGMGFVYRARDRNLDTEVVIKVPRRAMLEDPEFADRFAREVRALVKLAHPHIVKVTDVGDHDGLPFAVMQYLPGGSLDDRRPVAPGGQAAPMGVETLASWLPGVADALDFVHKQGYVHRDVKPANVLFDAHGHVFLSDFGVAKVVSSVAEARGATGTGMVLGTPDYMAPELVMGQPFDGRIDQYALAVTAYELLSGRRPFDGPTPTAILVQQTTGEPPPLRGPRIPDALSNAVHRALAKDPAHRFPDCSAFARAVMAAVGGSKSKTACPSCGAGLSLPEAARGKRVKCPSCATKLRVSDDLAVLTPVGPNGAATPGAITVPLARPEAEAGRPTQAFVKPATPSSARPAATVPELPRLSRPGAEALRPATSDGPAPAGSGQGVLWAAVIGVAALVVLLVGSGLAYMFLARRPTAPTGPPVIAKREPTTKPKLDPTREADDLFASAERALGNDQPDQAREFLHRYLVHPSNPPPGRAQTLQAEIDLAYSEAKAGELWRPLDDAALAALATDPEGLDSYIRRAPSPELRGPYAATLRRALLAEQARRRRARVSAPRAVARVAPRETVREPIEEVIAAPQRFEGKTVIPPDYVLIGTKVDPLRGTAALGLPVANKDNFSLTSGRVEPGRANLVIDRRVADRLGVFLAKVGARASTRRTNKAILTLDVRKVQGDGPDYWAAVITALEIHMETDYTKVANNVRYEAVKSVKITPEKAVYTDADADDWITRLGGERYTSMIKRKYRDFLNQQRIAREKAATQGLRDQMSSTINSMRDQSDLNRQQLADELRRGRR